MKTYWHVLLTSPTDWEGILPFAHVHWATKFYTEGTVRETKANFYYGSEEAEYLQLKGHDAEEAWEAYLTWLQAQEAE